MLYSVVEIKKETPYSNKYVVTHYDLDGDREEYANPEKDRMDASLGYYIYPRKLSLEDATLKLKLAMIRVRRERIKEIENSIFNISMV